MNDSDKPLKAFTRLLDAAMAAAPNLIVVRVSRRTWKLATLVGGEMLGDGPCSLEYQVFTKGFSAPWRAREVWNESPLKHTPAKGRTSTPDDYREKP